VSNRQSAHDFIDTNTDSYLEQALLGKVENFLAAMDTAWGMDSVFDYNSPDYHLAVAAITSIANRFGSLAQTTVYFQGNQPDSIQDVRDRFNTLLPTTNTNDWQLVQTGATLFDEHDHRFEGVASTIPLASAVTVLDVSTVDEAVSLFLKSEIGNRVTDVSYSGNQNAAFLIGQFSITGVFSLNGGLLLSSGGLPGDHNTSGSSSVSHGTPGDGDLYATALAAFPGQGKHTMQLSFNLS